MTSKLELVNLRDWNILMPISLKCMLNRCYYAIIMGGLINTDGFKDQGITFPSGAMQKKTYPRSII